MPGSRSERYRPAHSAHGHLYWWLVMWPTTVWRPLRRARRVWIDPIVSVRSGAGRRGRAGSHAARKMPPPPPPPPVSLPGAREPWATHEGAVRPLWDARDAGAR